MKKFISIVVLPVLVASTTACDGTVNANSWPLQQPENSYEIDAWGTNPDLLEFTPKGNEDYFCILAVSGGDDLKTMFCLPKKEV